MIDVIPTPFLEAVNQGLEPDDGLPPGTRLYFEQATPPEGWRIIAVHLLCEKE